MVVGATDFNGIRIPRNHKVKQQEAEDYFFHRLIYSYTHKNSVLFLNKR